MRKSILLFLFLTIATTCISCGDDFFEEEIIYRNDSIIYVNDSVPNNNSNPGDTTKTDTTKTDTVIINKEYVSIQEITKYMNQSSSGSVQGAAAYGDYLFQFQDKNEAVYVYNLAKKNFVKKITLTPNSNNHCNQASFSDLFYTPEDKFPLLYVSGSGNNTYSHIQVYRITGEGESFNIEQIQEIVLPPKTKENWIFSTCSMLDNENHYLYAYASNNSTRLIKFDIPDYHLNNVSLTDSDVLEFILLEHINHQQGGIIRKGIFYMIYGVPAWGDTVWLRLFNLETKTEIVRFNLTEKNFKGEPESIFFYKNELYAATNGSGIYKIQFKK